jgi:VIT1/CCC1 family predicted Fe2+/Mn2+ transporter
MTTDDRGVAALLRKERRALDPVDRVSEVIFGVIMALTFTCSLGVATSGRQEIREMLVGALGCNLAWGIVDGVMYVVTAMVQRARGFALVRAVKSLDDATARELVHSNMTDDLAPVADEAWLDRTVARLRALPAPSRRSLATTADFRGAIAVLLFVSLSTLPVAVPFMLIPAAHQALRVSNAVAIVLLFLSGVALARFAGLPRFRLGLGMAVLGSALVGVAVALGG